VTGVTVVGARVHQVVEAHVGGGLGDPVGAHGWAGHQDWLEFLAYTAGSFFAALGAG
jgi:hypothetical protein